MEEWNRCQARAVIAEICNVNEEHGLYTQFKISGTATTSGNGILWINCPGGLNEKQIALGKYYRELIMEYLLTPPEELAYCIHCKSSMTGTINRWGVWVCKCYGNQVALTSDDSAELDLMDVPAVIVCPAKKKKESSPRKYHRPMPTIKAQEASGYWGNVKPITKIED